MPNHLQVINWFAHNGSPQARGTTKDKNDGGITESEISTVSEVVVEQMSGRQVVERIANFWTTLNEVKGSDCLGSQIVDKDNNLTGFQNLAAPLMLAGCFRWVIK